MNAILGFRWKNANERVICDYSSAAFQALKIIRQKQYIYEQNGRQMLSLFDT
jgi:hypothetical protein